MAKHPNFRPLIGTLWVEALSDDELIINELSRLKLAKHLKQSKDDMTAYGKNSRLVLRFITGQAIMVWERKKGYHNKSNIHCVLFVNNSIKTTEELLQDAMSLARKCWIVEPFIAYLDPFRVPKNSEDVFKKCGWVKKDVTAAGVPVYSNDFGMLRY